MKRSLALATSIALAATTIIGVQAASADADLDVKADGVSIYDGDLAPPGSQVTFDATGCMTEGGQPGYMGIFISDQGDPLTSTADHGEAPAFPDGTFHSVFGVVPEDTDLVGVGFNAYFRWYCSASLV